MLFLSKSGLSVLLLAKKQTHTSPPPPPPNPMFAVYGHIGVTFRYIFQSILAN